MLTIDHYVPCCLGSVDQKAEKKTADDSSGSYDIPFATKQLIYNKTYGEIDWSILRKDMIVATKAIDLIVEDPQEIRPS